MAKDRSKSRNLKYPHSCVGCGKIRMLTRWAMNKKGYSGLCLSCGQIKNRGTNHYNWKGGRHVTGAGYVQIKMPNHPLSTKHGKILEHRLIASEKWGIFAVMNSVVHHKDGNQQNNKIENLKIMSSGEHSTLHNIERWHGKTHQ